MPMPCRRNSGKVASTFHVPRAWRLRLEQDQRPHERRDLFEAAEIVGIVEPVADEAGSDLASDLGDNGVAVGKAACLPRGTVAADFEDRLPRRFQRAPQIGRQAFAGDVDKHG